MASSDFSSFFKKFGKQVRKESKQLLENALRSGANNVGRELLNMADNVHLTPDPVLKKFSNALKSGVLATGEELMTVGMDRVKAASGIAVKPTEEAEAASTVGTPLPEKEE